MGGFPVLMFVLFAAVAIVVVVFGFIAAEKRRKEISAVAARLGLRFSSEDPFNLPRRHSHMPAFKKGHSRTAYNIMYGERDGLYTVAADYRYTVSSGKNSRTYRMTYCLLYTDKAFCNLHLRPENFLDTVAAWVGFDDIDFEYKEFNDAFYVRSDSKKFAYDIIHAGMMEFLLGNRGLHMEMSGGVILVHYDRTLEPRRIEPLIRTAHEIYRLLPSYV